MEIFRSSLNGGHIKANILEVRTTCINYYELHSGHSQSASVRFSDNQKQHETRKNNSEKNQD